MDKKVYYLFIGSLLLAIFLAVVVILNVKANESFTELFFEDPSSLPSLVKLGQKYGFAFTVHNLEGIEIRYEYVVKFTYDNKEKEIGRGSFILKNNESMVVQEIVSIDEKFKEGKVEVNLLNDDQEIHFFVKQEA